jgi:hypothetical protein
MLVKRPAAAALEGRKPKWLILSAGRSPKVLVPTPNVDAAAAGACPRPAECLRLCPGWGLAPPRLPLFPCVLVGGTGRGWEAVVGAGAAGGGGETDEGITRNAPLMADEMA